MQSFPDYLEEVLDLARGVRDSTPTTKATHQKPTPEPVKAEPTKGQGVRSFDPGAHTVAEVKQYVAAHPDEKAAVLAAEQAGKARTTVIDALS